MDLFAKCPKCDKSVNDIVCRACYEKLEQLLKDAKEYTNLFYKEQTVSQDYRTRLRDIKNKIQTIFKMPNLKVELLKEQLLKAIEEI